MTKPSKAACAAKARAIGGKKPAAMNRALPARPGKSPKKADY